MEVAAFTGGVQVPSARLRVHQFVPLLASEGVHLVDHPSRRLSYPPEPGTLPRVRWLIGELATRTAQVARSRRPRADVSLLQRELISTLVTVERWIPTPLVFDVDDAIWLNERRRGSIASIARRSAVVLAGNRNLAEWFGQYAPVRIVPTAVDVEKYFVAPVERPGPPVVGWCGTSSGFRYLETVVPALRSVLAARPDVRFAVMADVPPALDLPPDRWEFVPWTVEGEAPFLSNLAAGIMPLEDTPWDRCKCAYKMLSYMASGIPVVVSPVGMNGDLLDEAEIGFGATDHDGWVASLTALIDDRDRATLLGRSGRQLAEARYSVDVVGRELLAALRAAGR